MSDDMHSAEIQSVDMRPILVDSNIWLYMFLPGQSQQKAQKAAEAVA